MLSILIFCLLLDGETHAIERELGKGSDLSSSTFISSNATFIRRAPEFQFMWMKKVKSYGLVLKKIPDGTVWESLPFKEGDVLVSIDQLVFDNPFLATRVILESLNAMGKSRVLYTRGQQLLEASLCWGLKKQLLSSIGTTEMIAIYRNAAKLQSSFFSSYTHPGQAISPRAVSTALLLLEQQETILEIRLLLALTLKSMKIGGDL